MSAPKEQKNVLTLDKNINDGEQETEDQGGLEEENYVITPPNGGWGWVVVLGAFYCNVIVDGIQLTFGIFLKPISKSFNAEYSEVALAGSLMFGVHLLMGPICAGCNNVFGLRPVTITGSLICCFGVGISYFSTGYWYLYFSFGIIGGMGLGLVYMNSLVITSLYFTSLLPVAVGIVVCGTGAGTIIFAGLGHFLLRLTTWRNSFLMEAALAGSMGIAAIAFKPLKPVKVKISPSSPKSKSYFQNQMNEETSGSSSSKRKSLFIKTEVPSRQSQSSTRTLQSVAWSLAENMVINDLQKSKTRKCQCSGCCRKTRQKSEENILVLTEIKNDDRGQFQKSYVEKPLKSEAEGEEEIAPMERFHSSTSYKAVFTRIDFEEKKPKSKMWEPLKKTIIVMLDCRLLKSCSFFVFTMSGAFQVAALITVFIYEKDRTEELGFSEEMSVLFIITLGGANMFWRLFLGIFAIIPKINYQAVSISGIVVGGVATITSAYYTNIYSQLIFCVLFSLAIASFAVFRVVLLVDLVGLNKIATGTGINLLFMGVFSIISPPIFGWIMEISKSYNLIFLITGCLIVISGLMLIGLKKN